MGVQTRNWPGMLLRKSGQEVAKVHFFGVSSSHLKFVISPSQVPETGLEPALVSQPDPKSGASTNSATQATRASAVMIPDLAQAANELSAVLSGKQSQSQQAGDQHHDQRYEADF